MTCVPCNAAGGDDPPSPFADPAAAASDSCATLTATARHSDSKHRCSPRTPASRVRGVLASRLFPSRPACSNPCSSSTFGTTCRHAMASFSSSVYPGTVIISMRSRSGPGMVLGSFAVARNVILDRSNGTPM
eukprot:31315-Pelagococcus_subviridis.AAC.5